MRVELIRYTPEPDDLCGFAASLCTNAKNRESALMGALSSGHSSISEHAAFSFLISGVSRALLAQLTRHRIASFSVQSQRYISSANTFEYVVPPSICELGEVEETEYRRQMDIIHGWYREWQERLLAVGRTKQEANEDARFVLPNAAATKLLVTMNARELEHFFELRTCNRAQWEIRRMADKMLIECRKAAPSIFKNSGCACMQGKPCPEGRMCCGKPRKLEDLEA